MVRTMRSYVLPRATFVKPSVSLQSRLMIGRSFHVTAFKWASTPTDADSVKANTPLYPAAAATKPGVYAVPESPKFQKPRIVSTRSVGIWLLLSAAAVFGIVIIGGLTRLTESGLSITEWKPVTGSIPPLTQEEWEAEFAKYRESPEFKQLNSHITLDEFKFIFFMEWFHRLWGRAIGLMVVLPALYFVARGKTSPQTNRNLLLISGLIGFQGFLGWWMVKSGLDQDHLDSRHDAQPRVSQYRLAAHLGAAFLVYIAMTSAGLNILRENKFLRNPVEAMKDIRLLQTSAIKPFRRYSLFVFGMAFITCISGAFVAGLDAGMLYNTFPLMGGKLTPSKRELFDEDVPKRQGMEPTKFNVFWKNMLENPVTVQLNHRILAVTTWSLCLGLFLYGRRIRPIIPKRTFSAAHGVFGLATLQAALGISTLIYVVPIPLAACHQAGALAVLTWLVVLLNRLRVPRRQVLQLIQLLEKKALAAAPK